MSGTRDCTLKLLWLRSPSVRRPSQALVFSERQLDSPELHRKGLQSKRGLARAKTRREALLAPPRHQRLMEVATFSSLPQAHSCLLALPVPRIGQSMLAVHFSSRLRYRLCILIFSAGSVCPCCSALMDRRGDHALQCRVGKGVLVTHCQSSIRGLLYRLGRELGLAMVRKPHIAVRAPGTEGRRPDLLCRNWEDGRDLYIYVVGSCSLASLVFVLR